MGSEQQHPTVAKCLEIRKKKVWQSYHWLPFIRNNMFIITGRRRNIICNFTVMPNNDRRTGGESTEEERD